MNVRRDRRKWRIRRIDIIIIFIQIILFLLPNIFHFYIKDKKKTFSDFHLLSKVY